MEFHKASAPEPSGTSQGLCSGTFRNLTRYSGTLSGTALDRTGANLVRSGAAFCCWGKTTHNHAHSQTFKHVQLQSRKTRFAFGQLQVRTSGTARLYCKLEPAFSMDPFLSRCVMLRLSRCPARWQISNFLQRCKVHGVSPACEASFTAGLTATLTHPTLWNAMIKGIAMARVPSHGHMIFDVKSHGFTWYINVQYIVMILRCHLDMSRLFPYLSWDVWSYGSSHSAPWFISQLSRVLGVHLASHHPPCLFIYKIKWVCLKLERFYWENSWKNTWISGIVRLSFYAFRQTKMNEWIDLARNNAHNSYVYPRLNHLHLLDPSGSFNIAMENHPFIWPNDNNSLTWK